MIATQERETYQCCDRSVLMERALEFELNILGSMFFDAGVVDYAISRLKPEYFVYEMYSDLFRAAVSLYKKSEPCIIPAVIEECDRLGYTSKYGARELRHAITECCSNVVHTLNVDFEVQYMLKNFAALQSDLKANKAQEIMQNTGLSVIERMSALRAIEEEILSITESEKGHEIDSATLLVDTIDKINHLHEEGESSVDAIPTGFYDADSMLSGGLQPGRLITVAGRPGMGKSAFATQIGLNIASDTNKRVKFYTLEMDNNQMGFRFASHFSGIDSTRLRTGRVSENDLGRLYEVADKASEKFILNTNPDIIPARIYAEIKADAQAGKKPDVVIIDYLQLLTNQSDEYLTGILSEITRQLKKLTLSMGITVIILSQLNRGVESRNNKRPMLSDLRGSGGIEQDSDSVIFLYRDEVYNPDTSDRGLTEVIVSKNRDGGTGAFKLIFDAPTTTFKNCYKPGMRVA